LGVARFLINFFKDRGVGLWLVWHRRIHPQLDAAQRILIRTLLTEGFKTKLIASKASCTVRAVQRIRLAKSRQAQQEIENGNMTNSAAHLFSLRW